MYIFKYCIVTLASLAFYYFKSILQKFIKFCKRNTENAKRKFDFFFVASNNAAKFANCFNLLKQGEFKDGAGNCAAVYFCLFNEIYKK